MLAIRDKVEQGKMMNYSEYCSINSYLGWIKHCDSYRLKEKYITPLLPYAEQYYNVNIKSKKECKAA
jgi:hypothetical protein